MTARKIYTFRLNDATPEDHPGRVGEITYRDGYLYYHDGITPGGALISGGGGSGGTTTWATLSGKPSFAAVATSGSYADLTGKPAAQILQAPQWNALHNLGSGNRYLVGDLVFDSGTIYQAIFDNESQYTAVGDATYWRNLGSGVRLQTDYLDLANKPTLFSGAYADLTGKPTNQTLNTGDSVSFNRLTVTGASGIEGGEIELAKAPTSTLAGNVIIDVYENKLRFFEGGGNGRGFYLDLTTGANNTSTNIMSGGGGTGPQGPAGADGSIGPAGADGAQGPAGNDGAAGAQGPQGEPGAAGAQGPAGNDGAPGADGAQGPQGEPGTNGADGAQGPAGNDGAAGAQGPQGDPGAAGAQGPQGEPGTNGVDGAPGADGTTLPANASGYLVNDGSGNLAWAAGDGTFSGDYDDLTNKPTIPTSFSSLVNGSFTASLDTDGDLTAPRNIILNNPVTTVTESVTGTVADSNGNPFTFRILKADNPQLITPFADPNFVLKWTGTDAGSVAAGTQAPGGQGPSSLVSDDGTYWNFNSWFGLNTSRPNTGTVFTVEYGVVVSDTMISTTDTNLVIEADAKQYKFGTDGNLTLPAGGDIVNSTGTSVMGGSGSYAPAVPTNWASPAPTTIAEALDRIAAKLGTLGGDLP